jgi:TonB family protein
MRVFRLRSSITISVSVHGLFLLLWIALFGHQAAQLPRSKVTWIEVAPLEKSLTQAKKDEANSHRIVQTAKVEKTLTAAPDAFLGEQNQIVDRQTVSRSHETHEGAQTSRNSKSKSKSETKNLAKDKTLGNTLSKLGLAMLPSDRKTGGALNESDEPAYDGSAPSQASDYVKGFKDSEKTALSTKEYIFYGYFQRIRQRLDLAWGPVLREKLYKVYRSGRQLASDMDHTTKLMVTLNNQGEIVRVRIMEESGTQDLDDAAIKAFNQAGPFPNPPHGIVNAAGVVDIRWDFVLRT